MILEQMYLGCLSQASYLVGDEEAGVAAVVDPRRDVDVYLEEARKRGLAIRHVVLTHFHADFVSGHLELRERAGAAIHLGARANPSYAFSPLQGGDAVELGRVRLVAMETPGHTPEGISLLVVPPGGSPDRPRAVLTGDALFVGDVGRPDLMASQGVSAGELAGMLYDSTRRLCELPDETLVYPGHGAGSMCGKSLSKETVSTIGEQKRLNYALQPMSREEFVRLVTADQPAAPAYFGFDARLNREERETLDRALARALAPLSPAELLAAQQRGAQVLDARPPEEYAAAHLAGSVNVGIDGRYASWAGTVLDLERPLVLVAPEGREREAAMRLGRIGLDRIEGILAGGFAALAREPAAAGRITRTGRLDPEALAVELARPDPPLVVDVRAPSEREEAAIEESVHLPLPELAARADELPRDRDLVLQCAGGYRSMIAASLLEARGFDRLRDLAGGMTAWRAAGKPVAPAAALGS